MARIQYEGPEKRPEKNRKSPGALLMGILCLIMGFQLLAAGINVGLIFGVVGIPFAVVGLGLILLAARMILKKAGTELVRKTAHTLFRKKLGQDSRTDSIYPRSTDRSTFSFRGTDHQHILPIGISVEKRLEQLNVLRDAGLYTKEQYREAKQKILSQQ